MPVASLPEIMDRAFQKRYGVAAFNTVDDITMDGVIKAAEQSRSPLIVQISVKTVKFWGADVVQHMFADMASRVSVPVTLHLDHCPDPEFAKVCLEGWMELGALRWLGPELRGELQNSPREIVEVRRAARRRASRAKWWRSPASKTASAATTEGELLPIEQELAFIKDTGIYCYAPPIGTAHGFYKADADDPLRPDAAAGRGDQDADGAARRHRA